MAKQELFKLAEGNPEHLRALLSLVAVGLFEGDFGLLAASLGEISKLPPHLLASQDHEGLVPLMFSKFFFLQGNVSLASG